jgi:hypothetical protein
MGSGLSNRRERGQKRPRKRPSRVERWVRCNSQAGAPERRWRLSGKEIGGIEGGGGRVSGRGLVDGRVSVANWTVVRGFFISGVIVIMIIVNLGGSRERWITGSQRLARSPIYDGQHERRGPETETEPEKYGTSSFGVTPVGQSFLETVVTIPGVGVFRGILTPRLCPGRDRCDEAGAGGSFRTRTRRRAVRRTRSVDSTRSRFRSI